MGHAGAVLLEYGVNSVWQLPVVMLVLLGAARMVRRLGAPAVHRVYVAGVLLAAGLPACRVSSWPAWAWGHVGGISGGHVAVALGAAELAGGHAGLRGWLGAGLLGLWGVVTAGYAARLAWGAWQARALRCGASEEGLPGWVRQELPVLRGRMRLRDGRVLPRLERCGRARVRVLLSDRLPGPAAVARGTVLLPKRWFPSGQDCTVSEGELRAALLHELAHVRRGDFLKGIAYAVLLLPVRWHPCVWWLQKGLAASREEVCDGMAAAALGKRWQYARSLLRLAEAVGAERLAGAALGIFDGDTDGHTLERRVRAMTDIQGQVKGVRRWGVWMAAGVLMVGAAGSVARAHVVVGADEAQAVHVSSGEMAGLVVSKVQPVYPLEAKSKHDTLDGTVVLAVRIDQDGVPVEVHVEQGLRRDYDESAATAVQQWRWKPYLLNGEAVAVDTTVHVTYTIGK